MATSSNHKTLKAALQAAKKSISLCPDRQRTAIAKRISRKFAMALTSHVAAGVRATIPTVKSNAPVINPR